MQHLTLKATTTATDTELGSFTALVSAWSADREGDTIDRHAFDTTIAAWQASGKMLPLLLEHTNEVVGSVDPATMQTTAQGLVVGGEVDRSTPDGQRVWKSIKASTAGFSIGFLAVKSTPSGQGLLLQELDLLEISWTPKPMNAATRALNWKSADLLPTDAEIRERVKQMEAAELTAKAAKPIHIATFDC